MKMKYVLNDNKLYDIVSIEDGNIIYARKSNKQFTRDMEENTVNDYQIKSVGYEIVIID